MDFSPSESASSQRGPLSRETQFYYAGLPSGPPLVGRSSTAPWKAPDGPEAYNRPKVLGTVGGHMIRDLWEGNLSFHVVEHLDSKEVAWTSIDVVHIGHVEESFHPVILWTGVRPQSLSIKDGTKVACSCKEILVQSSITDVDVEISESSVNFLKGPKLLTTTFTSNPIVDARNPLTPTLSLPITIKHARWAVGMGGLFIAEGGHSKRLFLITARHIVFGPKEGDNQTFEYESHSARRREVILLSDAAFEKFLESIQIEIRGKVIMISFHERRITEVEHLATDWAKREYEGAQHELAEAKETADGLRTFYQDISKRWASPDECVLGHVIYSPPIKFGFGPGQCTQDFAVIDIDLHKIDATNFKGNVIDLGTKIGPDVFTRMMCPNRRNAYTFEYPVDRLLRLKGTIPDQDMRYLPMLD